MSMENNNTLEYIKSKSGILTALLNGIYLHSPTNPILEAQRFIHSKSDLLIKKTNFLVLGLGLGHHVNELHSQLVKLKKSHFKIYVIEPNLALVERYKHSYNELTIISEKSIKDIYSSKEFIQFLKLTPGIIIHQGSYSAQKDFFQEFLKYRNSKSLDNILSEIKFDPIINILNKFNHNDEIHSIMEKIKGQISWNTEEKIILAYNSLK